MTPSADGSDASAFCSLALDRLAALVRVWTPAEGVVYVNRPWLEFTGTTVEENHGDGWLQCIHERDRPAVRQALQRLHDVQPLRLHYRVRRLDGTDTQVCDSARPWIDPGTSRPQGLVHTCVTDDPSVARDAQAHVMGHWAHELRGSLNAILGWSDLLSGGETSPEIMQRGLNAIADNARRQAAVIRRMTE